LGRKFKYQYIINLKKLAEKSVKKFNFIKMESLVKPGGKSKSTKGCSGSQEGHATCNKQKTGFGLGQTKMATHLIATTPPTNRQVGLGCDNILRRQHRVSHRTCNKQNTRFGLRQNKMAK
jgi:hypothetical protein